MTSMVEIDVRFLLIAFWVSTILLSFAIGAIAGIFSERFRK